MSTEGRLYLAAALLDLAAHLPATRTDDSRLAYTHARTIHHTITNWAFQPTRQRPDSKATTDQWCRHCLTTGGWCEPVWRAGLCTWCYSFQHDQNRGLPCLFLLAWHHDDKRVTQQLIDKHQPPKRKKKVA